MTKANQFTCIKLAPKQSAWYLAEVSQHLKEQGSVPGQSRREGTDGNDYRAMLPPELSALLLPQPHQL